MPMHQSLSSDILAHYMVDCGEGTFRQMVYAGMGQMPLAALLITHLHYDHVRERSEAKNILD